VGLIFCLTTGEIQVYDKEEKLQISTAPGISYVSGRGCRTHF
jgi:hypothetical protein